MTGTVIASGQAPWIPVAHRMELLRGRTGPAERELVTAAFVLVLDAADALLLTHVNLPGRGWDIPGGHIDPGENPAEAATREVAEETGLALTPEEVELAGWQRFTLLAAPPDWYPYPFPLSYTLMFAARLAGSGPAVTPPAGSECGPAQWCTAAEVAARCAGASWLPFTAEIGRSPATGRG